MASSRVGATEGHFRTYGISVLHCVGSLGGGGAERQLAYLFAESLAKGVDAHVAYVNGGPLLDSFHDHPERTHRLAVSSNYDPRCVWKLLRLILKLKPAIVQSWLPQMDVMAGVAACLTGTAFVLCERSVAPAYVGFLRKTIRELIGRQADFIVANSYEGMRYWLCRNRDVRIVRNGIPVDLILQAPARSFEQFGVRAGLQVLLYAGRYSEEKNLPSLLKAVLLVMKTRSDLACVFFGDGPVRQLLTNMICNERAEGRVKILPYTTNIWGFMKTASLFMSVSLFEGCPNTVLEAAVQSCPLLLSDIPAHRELFDSNSAAFTASDVPETIATSISDVLADPVATAKRKERAFSKAASLRISDVTSEYIHLYETLATRQHNGL